MPSPLYLKYLYSHGEKLITKPPVDHDDECDTTKELENKLVVRIMTFYNTFPNIVYASNNLFV